MSRLAKTLMRQLGSWDGNEECWEIFVPVKPVLRVTASSEEADGLFDLQFEMHEALETAGLTYGYMSIEGLEFEIGQVKLA